MNSNLQVFFKALNFPEHVFSKNFMEDKVFIIQARDVTLCVYMHQEKTDFMKSNQTQSSWNTQIIDDKALKNSQKILPSLGYDKKSAL